MECNFAYQRDCPNDVCVAGAIQNYTHQLSDEYYYYKDWTTGSSSSSSSSSSIATTSRRNLRQERQLGGGHDGGDEDNDDESSLTTSTWMVDRQQQQEKQTREALMFVTQYVSCYGLSWTTYREENHSNNFCFLFCDFLWWRPLFRHCGFNRESALWVTSINRCIVREHPIKVGMIIMSNSISP